MISDFKKKQKSRLSVNDLYTKVFIVIFVIVIILLIIANIKMYKKKMELVAQEKRLSEEVLRLKNDTENLKYKINNANDTAYIEKVAREEMGLQKQGENVISFISAKQQDNNVLSQNNSRKWYSWFFDFWNWLLN